jgi:hypothetical protein
MDRLMPGTYIYIYILKYSFEIIDLFSSIRLVPNNQEVYMHNESDQSIIVEILERVDEVSDENSIK